jgi:thiosulfate/3-mercaptopyruvate sulfurtransferase
MTPAFRSIATRRFASPISLIFSDCRYTLGDPGKGRRDYDAGHLPGAIFASLDDDLASPHVPGRTGRHPLPEKSAWLDTLSGWGIAPATQIVAYDGGVGQSAAGRLWWMLKWAGHDRVAVLDGGFPRWVETGNLLTTAPPSHRQNHHFEPRWRDDMQVSAAEVAARLAAGSATVLDARAVERFRGEVEPIDPVAGHIPGAISAPYLEHHPWRRHGAGIALTERFDALRLVGGLKMSSSAGPRAIQICWPLPTPGGASRGYPGCGASGSRIQRPVARS